MHVVSFIAGLNVIVNKIRSVQIELDDKIIIGKVTQCLQSEFDSFRQSWRLSVQKPAFPVTDQLCRSMQAVSIGEALVGKRTTSKEPNGISKKRNIECWNCKKEEDIYSDCRSQRKINSNTPKDRPRDLSHAYDVEVLNGKQWIVSVLNDVPEFRSNCLFSIAAAAARGYKIMMDNFNTRLMMNNRTELCGFGSMTQKPHKEIIELRKSVHGKILHAHACGPFIHPSVGDNRYFICIKDESSGYHEVYFMNGKNEVLRYLKIAMTEIKQEIGCDVQRIRTDGGTEFVNKEFDNFHIERRIVHEKSPPYTTQCNGMAERENKTPVEKARSMLHARNLPRSL
ncbi:Retrovirus-related Pol polyprotein from transposon TNT 1-94 [Trichinella nelsoni]|uniref:Retrovirus-related Pol polyprotein from transposon TNT 1-94 n=1 Tax=Trichinella nelsoni TaxID=6336 RepID=A0A0V0S850_9BILA|nr:Retrovirus-related Pol polyprotein from transposon TNT 1-94 [Trichinella nelsoni]